MIESARKLPILLAAAVCTLHGLESSAATLYFDPSPAADGSGANATTTDWEAASLIWTQNPWGQAGTNVGYTADSDVIFASGYDFDQSATVLPKANFSVTSLQFVGASVTLGDHSSSSHLDVPILTLSGSGGLHVENQDSTIKSKLSATVNVVKTGLGKLTLDHGSYGTSGYFGGSGRTWIIEQGILELKGSVSSDAVSGARIEVKSGATLQVNGPNILQNQAVIHTEYGGRVFYTTTDAMGNLSGNGWVSVTSQLNIDLGSTHTFSGNLEGSGILNFRSGNNNAGILSLGGANTFRGTISFAHEAGKPNHGTLRLDHRRALQSATLNMDHVDTVYDAEGIRFAVGIEEFIVGNITANERVGVVANLILQNDNGDAITLYAGNNNANSRFTGVISGVGSLGKIGTGTLTLDRANTYTGDTIVSAGFNNSFSSNAFNSSTLALDFSAEGAPTSQIISSSSRLVMDGGKLNMIGSTAGTNSQRFSSTLLKGAHSQIAILSASAAALHLGEITRETGGLAWFILPGGTQNASHGITTTNTNTHGILGAWARVDGNWATVVSNGTTQNIVAYSDYTIHSGTTLASNASSNVKIDASNSSSLIELSGLETTVNTLYFEHNEKRIVKFQSDQTLRIASGGIWFKATGSHIHQIGDTASVGSLTAGAAPDVDAELIVYTDGTSQIYSKIVDNGTGKVTLVKAGASDLHLHGVSTYTGGTIVAHGRVNQQNANSFGANVASNFIKVLAGGHVFFNGSTVNNDLYIAGNGWGETAVPAAIRLSNTNLQGTLTLTGNATIGTHAGAGISNNHLRGKITGDYQLGFTAGGSAAITSGGTYNLYNPANDFKGGLTLNGIDGYSGAVNDRVVTVKNGASEVIPHGVGFGDVLINGATTSATTLDLNGFNETINGLLSGATHANAFITNNHSSASSTSELKVGAHHGFANFSGVIKDGSAGAKMALTKVGSGTQELGGANTYSGDTKIEDGTLKAAAAHTFSANSKVWIADKATAILDLNHFSQTIKELSGGGYVNFGTKSQSPTMTELEIQQSTHSVYGGKIVGTGSLKKTETGRLILSGENTYLGQTRVEGGNLQVGLAGEGTTGQGQVFVSSASVLSGSGIVKGAATLQSGAVLRPGDDGGAAYGTLKFDSQGNGLTLNSGSKVELQVGGATGNEANPFDGIQSAELLNGEAGDHDQLEISGSLELHSDATVEVRLASGYNPNVGDVLNIIDWGVVSGTLVNSGFDVGTSLDIETTAFMIANDLSWSKSQFLSDGIVYVIPEPSRGVLSLLAMLGLTMGRRRKL